MSRWLRLTAVFCLFFSLSSVSAVAAGTGGGAISGSSSGATATSTTATQPGDDGVTAPGQPGSSGGAHHTLALASYAFGSRLLKLGSVGTDVQALQRDLTALRFRVNATGEFTSRTYVELRAFQRKHRLVADGVVGKATVKMLERLLSSSRHIAQGQGALVSASAADQPLSAADSGGVGVVPLAPTTDDTTVQDATLIDGLVYAASGTPQVVQKVIAAANAIAFKPYIYGGGHASFESAGYDCSGSVSYALHGGGLLATPLDSEQFLQYGLAGVGKWITIWTNGPTHVYMEIAGIWFDTAAQTAADGMDRWSLTRIGEPPAYGRFVPRHPAGW
ncbi:MAG: peptidoglycan-binding domain-containing protein [Solirubrobacteraceae bacterium]